MTLFRRSDTTAIWNRIILNFEMESLRQNGMRGLCDQMDAQGVGRTCRPKLNFERSMHDQLDFYGY